MVDGDFDPVMDTLSSGDGKDVIFVLNKPAGKDLLTCGDGFDRVLADRADVVAPDCEKVKVSVGFGSAEEWFNSIPQAFFEGLHPQFS